VREVVCAELAGLDQHSAQPDRLTAADVGLDVGGDDRALLGPYAERPERGAEELGRRLSDHRRAASRGVFERCGEGADVEHEVPGRQVAGTGFNLHPPQSS